jgi:hypothetical protein
MKIIEPLVKAIAEQNQHFETLDAKLEVLLDDLCNASLSASALIKKQDATNGLLMELIAVNKQFISTLTSFLKEDHKVKVEEEKKKSEQARQLEPSKDDLRY